jgi:hypothetical protein
MMISNVLTRSYLMHALMAVTLLSQLTACQKPVKADTPSVDEPTISENAVHFSANSRLKQSVITAPVISSQDNQLSSPYCLGRGSYCPGFTAYQWAFSGCFSAGWCIS